MAQRGKRGRAVVFCYGKIRNSSHGTLFLGFVSRCAWKCALGYREDWKEVRTISWGHKKHLSENSWMFQVQRRGRRRVILPILYFKFSATMNSFNVWDKNSLTTGKMTTTLILEQSQDRHLSALTRRYSGWNGNHQCVQLSTATHRQADARKRLKTAKRLSL